MIKGKHFTQTPLKWCYKYTLETCLSWNGKPQCCTQSYKKTVGRLGVSVAYPPPSPLLSHSLL